MERHRLGAWDRIVTVGGIVAAAWLAGAWFGVASAAEIRMKDGRVIRGDLGRASSLAQNPNAKPEDIQLIVLADNGLKRTFVPFRMIEEVNEADSGEVPEKFRISQEIPSGGFRVNSVGPIIEITPFDEYGRRIFRMSTDKGPIAVVQGITMITPTWTKVEALQRYTWDMRIATSSIPREHLHKIIAKELEKHQLQAKSLDYRLKVVRLFIQSDRYQDARKELEEIVAAFPDRAEEFNPTVLKLKQTTAQRILAEIKLLRDGGQHRAALVFLKQFPAEGVAGVILQEVRELLEEYEKLQERGKNMLELVEGHFAALTDDGLRKRVEPMVAEIKRELNINTLDRLVAYQQLSQDAGLSADQKLSLAISGWLLGKDGATEKMGVALSLYEIRELVHRYFNETVKINRDTILQEIRAKEGADTTTLAKLLAHMKPPLETPELNAGASPVPAAPEGPAALQTLQLSIPGLGSEAPVEYLVQLPPEYDPYRRYPAVVTLHGGGTLPDHQIDWWAGARDADGSRRGQATRQGYIVIAPAWAKAFQREHRYSASEHHAVLGSLRDACKRFSIDTDRVYLSGHSMGGDAAWDIALAHPDLWAGVIPIVGVSDKYCAQYWPNGRDLPMYVVSGELDGDKMVRNSRELDRYLNTTPFNCTVVEYLGRGHEHFSDEILSIFDWMGRYRRNFFPRKFTVKSMRPWDNFFWWLELAEFPEKSMVDPAAWPPGRNVLAITTEGTALNNNNINVKTGAGRASIWLSPDVVDFKAPMQVKVNGSVLTAPGGGRFVEPDIAVLLEDVRTRGDRQHPFWAKIETPGGRGSVRLGSAAQGR
jgi:acetyl esterase/lipase